MRPDNTWRLLTAKVVPDVRGKLAALESPELPFVAARVFYIYDLPADSARGGHAHRALHQCLVCLRGALHVTLDNGTRQERVVLDSPETALYIPPMTWAAQTAVAADTAYFVLASDRYDEADYYRNYHDFLHAARQGSQVRDHDNIDTP